MCEHWPEQDGEGVGSKEHGVARRGREFWKPRLVRENQADQPGHQAKLGVGLDDRHFTDEETGDITILSKQSKRILRIKPNIVTTDYTEGPSVICFLATTPCLPSYHYPLCLPQP